MIPNLIRAFLDCPVGNRQLPMLQARDAQPGIVHAYGVRVHHPRYDARDDRASWSLHFQLWKRRNDIHSISVQRRRTSGSSTWPPGHGVWTVSPGTSQTVTRLEWRGFMSKRAQNGPELAEEV